MSFRVLRTMQLCRWVVLSAIVVVLPHRVHAQEQPETYSLVIRGVPLSTALEALVARTEMDLAYDPPLVREKRASCAIEDAPAESLLRCVLAGTGLDFYRLSSGLYVLIPTPETVPLYGGVQGIVVDAATRQPLPRSHVMLADRTSGTTSNDAGMFAFSRLRPGRYVVIATHVGYRSAATAVDVPPGSDTRTELALESDPIVVQPIVIDGLQWRLPSSGLGRGSISSEDLLDNPSAGASDVLAGLNSLLGVRVSDATADIHVQGGETGEHQLRLDGAPVFLPLNFASFVGPFSPFAIGNITVHKAGFGASEGSQISGVIDVQQDVNFAERRRLDVQLDPLSVNARLGLRGGQRGGVQGTFMAAGRASLWNLHEPPTLKSFLNEWNTIDPFLYTLFDRSSDNPRFGLHDSTTGNPVIGFRDLHTATRIRFSALKSLHASAYLGQTRFGSDLPGQEATPATEAFAHSAELANDTYRDLFTWDTGTGQARYEVVLSSKVLASIGMRGSYYRVRHDYSVPDSADATQDFPDESNPLLERIDDGNRIYEVAAEGHLDYALDERNNVTAGTELVQTGSRFDILGTQRFPIYHSSSSWRLAGFLEDEMTINERLTAEFGSRATYLSSRKTVYLEPRAALRYDTFRSPLGPFSAKISTGLFRQFISQFDVSSRSPRALLSSTRFWLASDSTMRPPAAVHYAAEILFKPSDVWSIRLEGYRKQQHRILAIDYATEGTEDRRDLDQREFLRESSGAVRGVGIQVQRKLGAGRIETQYEYSAAERTNEVFFEGQSKFAPWNEPHRIEIALDVVPIANLTLLARWRGVWGRTWGFRQAYYDFVGAFNQIASDLTPQLIPKAQRHIDHFELKSPEEHELPPIYQLDLSAAYGIDVGRSRLQMRVDVLNVLDRDNVAEWNLTYDEATYFETGFLEKSRRPLLPRLASVAVKWTW